MKKVSVIGSLCVALIVIVLACIPYRGSIVDDDEAFPPWPPEASLSDELMPAPRFESSKAKTWTVEPGPESSAAPIQAAIDRAMPGDTILLKPGVYLWHKNDSTETPPEPAVRLKNVKSLTLRSDGDAYVFCTDYAAMPLEIFDASDLLIENVHFGHAGLLGYTCTAATAWLYGGNSVTFRNCVLHGSGREALAGWKNKRVLVDGCALGRGTFAGIDLSFTTGLTVRGCYLADCGTDNRARCLLDLVLLQDMLFWGNMIHGNHNKCFLHADRTQRLNFSGNVFFDNAFEMPDDLRGSNFTVTTQKWPNDKAQRAAENYRRFLDVLKELELTIH